MSSVGEEGLKTFARAGSNGKAFLVRRASSRQRHGWQSLAALLHVEAGGVVLA